ncbi:MAG: aryl-sulfate sulfotransferase [Owenweeksia sp.]|nr:aryl-sulfate sulfotransferase [Owenweeksia sp.]
MITWPVKRLKNGDFYLGNSDGIYILNMLGQEISHIPLSGYRAHHEVVEMPNGHLLVSVQKYGTYITDSVNGSIASTDDHVIEIDRSGNLIQEWDLRQILDVDRHDLTDGQSDWFHMNAIWYSEDDDCLIISGRNQGW